MRIAVIGLGSIGQRHARNFLDLGCTVDTFDTQHTDRTLDDVLIGRDGIHPDGVVIATPPETHTEIAWKVLGAGAHVMIEKPVATDLTDLGHLFKAYEVAGLTHMVAYPWRYDPNVGTLMDKVRACGPARFARFWYAYEGANATAMRMGPILDCSHAIDMARWILGDVTDLTATMEGAHAELVMRFGACTATMHLGLDSALRCEWEIFSGVRDATEWRRHPSANIDHMYRAEAQHFLDCIAGTAKPLTDGWDGRETLRVCLAAQTAARERRWIAR